MKFLDLFSGIGGFTEGMKQAGHECVGHCEFDKYAEGSYRAMHCITEMQKEHLLTLDKKKRQKEILKEEYLNGLKIRKLTPKECFRLQGWEDDFFNRAEMINSNSQLYKQAGNGVTVNVIYEIARRLKERQNWKEEVEQ